VGLSRIFRQVYATKHAAFLNICPGVSIPAVVVVVSVAATENGNGMTKKRTSSR